jgi:hypothetical protein
VTADTSDGGVGAARAFLDWVRQRWRGLDRGWQASILGVLVVVVALTL